ncbi:immunophilin [Tribonema minus]|uniref:Immunophilin n=1 Tax=Tribonema minus TaxID=303371 RepID=A0A836CB35_9STRA|nr:immunophilin [Tribonema minus]
MVFGGGGGGKGMPPLFDGWFEQSRYLEKSMVSAVKASAKVGRPVEVLFPCVPNLDEVAFGTPLNQAFGKSVARDLGMPEYKPGSKIKTYLVQFSNVYWAKRLAEGLGGNVWALCTDGLKKDDVTKPGRMKFASINKPESYADVKKGDTVIVVQPGVAEQWRACEKRFTEQKLIFLNAPISTTYDLGGPLQSMEQAYYLKRVSKGWAFRAYPAPWTAYLEKPDSSVEVLCEYKDGKPSLRELSGSVREESLRRYAIFNDRFAPGFGGRL